MAQETAGTIGIPVIKNEILPYLTDYAKRRERAELYKQKAEQRAAELAAKKAAEEAKYVPKFEAGLGSDMWEHVDRAKNEADIQRGLQLAKDQTVPRQQVMSASNEINRNISQRSNISKQLKETTLKTAEDLKNRYRKVGPEYAYQWARQQQDYRSPEEFAAEVRSNPALIDFDAIGKKAKEYKLQQYSYRGRGGETKEIDISPLFEYKMQVDPVLKTQVPVITGVNGIEAQELIESDPDIKEAFDVYRKSKAKEIGGKTYFDPQTGSPMMLRPEVADEKAAEEFMNAAFGKYGKIKYGQSFQLPSRRDGGGDGREKADYSYRMKPSIVTSPRYDNSGNKTDKTIKIGSASDTGYPMGTTNHQAGLRGVPLGSTEEMATYITPNGDGTYTINRSITYDNPIDRKVYKAKQDIIFFDKNGNQKNRVKKGDILDNDEAGVVLSGPNKNLIREEDGVQITARLKTPVGDEEKEVVMFVGGDDASSIRANIAKFQKKVKPNRTVKKISF